jgi:hypothetical protein
LTLYGLGNDEPEIMGHALFEAPLPVRRGICMPEIGLDPYFVPTQFDCAGWYVIRPEIKGCTRSG